MFSQQPGRSCRTHSQYPTSLLVPLNSRDLPGPQLCFCHLQAKTTRETSLGYRRNAARAFLVAKSQTSGSQHSGAKFSEA